MPEHIVKLIRSLQDSDKHIFQSGEGWSVTTEWLCGAFAGREFTGPTLIDAVNQMSAYLDAHVGHNSIVGNCVSGSGWPNLEAVTRCLTGR